MGEAVFWGTFSSAALFLGQLLAKPLGRSERAIGLMMGFGGGTLLAAVAYELIPESHITDGWQIVTWAMVGALAYYFGDQLIDRRGGGARQAVARGRGEGGSGMAMFLGALLDGIPEAFILGLGLALGGQISLAFLAAIFVSNVPQGLAGTTSLEEAGTPDRRITVMWALLTAACGVAAGLGFLMADEFENLGTYASAFAGGAVLMMLADSMIPESYRHGGRLTGLLTVVGFLVAGVLTVLQ
jgi:zinc transporter, ZIP family